eukprot:g25321.t1
MAIADRRQLRRKLSFWRIAALLCLVAVGFVAYRLAFDPAGGSATPHIARVRISGMITDDKELLERLERIAESGQAKALIVSISSPGGTTYGGERLFRAIRKVAEKKPVVSDIRTLAASAGYMIATAGDTIVAGESSITGSIGVIFQYPQVDEVMKKVGVSLEEIKSSPLKAEPSPFHPASEEAKAMIRNMIMDSYGWFVDLVADRRQLPRDEVVKLADGTIFTGRQALAVKLVDKLGGDDDILDYLQSRDISRDLPIVEWKDSESSSSLWFAHALTGIFRLAGISLPLSPEAIDNWGTGKLFLDGLVSVWQGNAVGLCRKACRCYLQPRTILKDQPLKSRDKRVGQKERRGGESRGKPVGPKAAAASGRPKSPERSLEASRSAEPRPAEPRPAEPRRREAKPAAPAPVQSRPLLDRSGDLPKENVPLILESASAGDFRLIDSGRGLKLEQYGPYQIVRPEAQALWQPSLAADLWQRADAVFTGNTDEDGMGRWKFPQQALGETWPLSLLDIDFLGRFTAFRHVGVFPEQIVHWTWMKQRVEEAKRPLKVLNLFGYTGVASLVAAAAGAEVTHVDASKKAIGWARENQALSRLEKAPIRWICEDAMKFILREERRGSTYDIILTDPPKFGRGPNGEVWELFEHLPVMLDVCRELLSKQAVGLVLTAYSIRASFYSIHELMRETMRGAGGLVESGELVKEVTSLANPIIKDIKALANKKDREAAGTFMAEGLKLVLDAMELGWSIRTLIYAKAAKGKPLVEQAATHTVAHGGLVLEVSEKVLSSVTRRDNPQMVVGIFEQRWKRLEDVSVGKEETIVALDRVRDPGNLGTIIRTADAAGASAVILIDECTDPFSLETVRATMGSVFAVPVIRCTSEEFIAWQKRAGVQVVATHLAGAVDYRTVDYARKASVILMGNEQSGLPDKLAKAADQAAGRFRLNTRAENLRQLIESVVEMLAYRAHEKRIEIAATFAADLPERLDFDPARLRQVLFNVIGNAVKFTFEGGVLVRASVRDGNVAIEVEDTGPGMTEEERRRIFADFEQVGLADARSGGTGLGLGIASRILAEFGGALAVRSTKGQGSVFTIRFPVQLGEDAPAGMVDRRRLLSTSRVLLLAPPGPSATATVATIEALGGRCRHVVAAEQVQLLIDRADRGPAPFTDLIVDHRAACDYADASRHRPLHRILLVNPEERASQPQDLFDAWLIRPLREKSLIDVLSGRLRGFGNGRSVAPDQQADLKSKEDGPAAGGLDIILAEDDPVSATLVKAMLHKNGHRVNWVDDVPRFVAALREPGARADLLITDMNMPGGDPLEALALARDAREVDAAQAVRYRVFVEEMGATLTPEAMQIRRDIDAYDAICDHLLVVDHAIEGEVEDQIVGTYRLLRQEVAKRHGGFYSASEFDIEPLLARHPDKQFMELGRSCVLPEYRTKRTVELLWQGNWAYSLRHGMQAMFGCASFSGVNPQDHALALSFLHHSVQAKEEWAVSAHPSLYTAMDMMPLEAIDARRALMALPPLIKGYLRLGAMIGDGAVIDQAFNTTDVLVVLPIASISSRYVNYYGADAGRFSG